MKVEYVSPSAVDIGDKIAASFTVNDVKVTNVGTVAVIHRNAKDRAFISGEGVIIGRWQTSQVGHTGLRVVMLKRYAPATVLPIFANLPEGVRERAS